MCHILQLWNEAFTVPMDDTACLAYEPWFCLLSCFKIFSALLWPETWMDIQVCDSKVLGNPSFNKCYYWGSLKPLFIFGNAWLLLRSTQPGLRKNFLHILVEMGEKDIWFRTLKTLLGSSPETEPQQRTWWSKVKSCPWFSSLHFYTFWGTVYTFYCILA